MLKVLLFATTAAVNSSILKDASPYLWPMMGVRHPVSGNPLTLRLSSSRATFSENKFQVLVRSEYILSKYDVLSVLLGGVEVTEQSYHDFWSDFVYHPSRYYNVKDEVAQEVFRRFKRKKSQISTTYLYDVAVQVLSEYIKRRFTLDFWKYLFSAGFTYPVAPAKSLSDLAVRSIFVDDPDNVGEWAIV